MTIRGLTEVDNDGVQLYHDTKGCVTGGVGPSVCDDVIKIPILKHQPVRYVKILTSNYLMLCEVQVFAGMLVVFIVYNYVNT